MRVDISSCENKNTLNEIEGHIDTDAILSIHMLIGCQLLVLKYVQVCVVGKYVLSPRWLTSACKFNGINSSEPIKKNRNLMVNILSTKFYSLEIRIMKCDRHQKSRHTIWVSVCKWFWITNKLINCLYKNANKHVLLKYTRQIYECNVIKQ